jgi:hypothetical protein
MSIAERLDLIDFLIGDIEGAGIIIREMAGGGFADVQESHWL